MGGVFSAAPRAFARSTRSRDSCPGDTSNSSCDATDSPQEAAYMGQYQLTSSPGGHMSAFR